MNTETHMEVQTAPMPIKECIVPSKQKTSCWPWLPNIWPIIVILIATVGLIRLGLLFCWNSPIGAQICMGSHYHFSSQLFWLILGFGLSVCVVYIVGWRRCVKSAPWLMSIWLALFAFAHLHPMVGRSHSWLVIGPFRIELWALFPVVFPLFMAWLHGKIGKMAYLVLLGIILAGGMVASVKIATNANRMARIRAFLSEDVNVRLHRNTGAAWAQNQLCAAFAEADWFSGKNVSVRYVPQVMTSGAMSTSALVFGKWFPAATCMLMCLLGAGFALVGCCTTDGGKRMFAALAGALLLGPAIYSYLCCLKIVPYLHPMLDCAVPFVSYGGTLAAGTLVVIGLFVAQYIDSWVEWPFVPHFNLPVRTMLIVAVGIGVGLIMLMQTANRYGLAFSTTRPDESIATREVWM